MSFKKMLLFVCLILLGGTNVAAQQNDQTTMAHWRWAETGISFDYPADWKLAYEDPFEFILYAPTKEAGGSILIYLGLQVGQLQNDATLESTIQEFAASFRGEVSEIVFGGVDALRIDT